jgi:hypothetical protein
MFVLCKIELAKEERGDPRPSLRQALAEAWSLDTPMAATLILKIAWVRNIMFWPLGSDIRFHIRQFVSGFLTIILLTRSNLASFMCATLKENGSFYEQVTETPHQRGFPIIDSRFVMHTLQSPFFSEFYLSI